MEDGDGQREGTGAGLGDAAVDLGGPERWHDLSDLRCLIDQVDQLVSAERTCRVQIGRFCFDTGDVVGRASLQVAASWLRAQCNSIDITAGGTDPDERASCTNSANDDCGVRSTAGSTTTEAGQPQTSSGLTTWFCAPVSSAAHATPLGPPRSRPCRRPRLTADT